MPGDESVQFHNEPTSTGLILAALVVLGVAVIGGAAAGAAGTYTFVSDNPLALIVGGAAGGGLGLLGARRLLRG